MATKKPSIATLPFQVSALLLMKSAIVMVLLKICDLIKIRKTIKAVSYTHLTLPTILRV